MSNSCLIRWIEHLLFGSSAALPHPPPELKNILLRMEAENIPWDDIVFKGGLTAFPYQVHGDLNYLTDQLENESRKPPTLPFKTKAVTKFWIELQMWLSRRDETPLPALPPPTQQDDAILNAILEENHPGPHAFQSAAFWGEIARKCLHLRRPETLSVASPAPPDDLSRRLLLLYDVFCTGQGQSFEPFNLMLVHHSEHVNAAHWQTPHNLEAFMHDRPSHPLTLSIQRLLKRTIDDVVHGETPSAFLNPCPQLDAFLHNVRVIDASVEKVSHPNAPPKLIDLFQRLLALCYQDNLWERKVPVLEPSPSLAGTSLFYLTERLRIAEREKRALWQQVTTSGKGFAAKPPPRTCADYLYASDSYPRSSGERARSAFPR